MQKIASDFSYDNYNPSGEIKDICKVYLKFFQHLQLAARVEDLKRAYANNKLINVNFSVSLRLILFVVPNDFHSRKMASRDLSAALPGHHQAEICCAIFKNVISTTTRSCKKANVQ